MSYENYRDQTQKQKGQSWVHFNPLLVQMLYTSWASRDVDLMFAGPFSNQKLELDLEI